MTITICIGNSDDKLSQVQWFNFCRDVEDICTARGQVHFAGYSPPDRMWQNACFVTEILEMSNWLLFREDLVDCRKRYSQDSVAWIHGDTALI